MDLEEAISIAKEARKNSYAPYSNYYVGCALKGKSGKIYSGCNIENGGIMAICSERVAFTKAISEGEKEFEYIVVAGGSDKNNIEACTPCGYCRQFMNEFVKSDFKIFVYNGNDFVPFSISELLPNSYNLNK